jgi:hypothetical protein
VVEGSEVSVVEPSGWLSTAFLEAPDTTDWLAPLNRDGWLAVTHKREKNTVRKIDFVLFLMCNKFIIHSSVLKESCFVVTYKREEKQR